MPKRFCLDCRKLTDKGSRCPECQATLMQKVNAKRGTTTQRGLGWAHQKRAAEVLAGVECCPRCGREPTPDNPLTAHHSQARARGGGDSPLVPLCRKCNSEIGDRTG